MNEASLYQRLGGYEAINAVADELLSRLMKDDLLGRFWHNRGDDGINREKQLLIDFLCSSAGGPMLYTGRDMLTTHRGMKISEVDWQAFLQHLRATLTYFNVPNQEYGEVLAFVDSTKSEIVE